MKGRIVRKGDTGRTVKTVGRTDEISMDWTGVSGPGSIRFHDTIRYALPNGMYVWLPDPNDVVEAETKVADQC